MRPLNVATRLTTDWPNAEKEPALSARHSDAARHGRIQLDHILQNELAADYFNGSWVSFDEIAFYDLEYNLCLYNTTSKTVKHAIAFPYVVS